MFTGSTSALSAPYVRAWIVRVDSAGDRVWERLVGDGFGSTVAYTPAVASDGGIFVNGHIQTVPGYWVMKLDPSGALLWQRAYVGDGSAEGPSSASHDGGLVLGLQLSHELPPFLPVRAWVLKIWER